MILPSPKHLLRQLKSILRYPIIDIILSLGIVVLVELKHYKFYHITPFPDIGDFIFFIVFLLLVYAVIGFLRKAISDSDILFNTEIKDKLDKLIGGAEDYLYLISPYLNLGNLLTESLLKSIRGRVRVVMVHHTDQLKNEESMFDMRRLKEAGCEMWHHPNLHAKIYLNEKEMIITSLNLVKGSFDNSLESGYKTSHKALHQETLKYIKKDILESDLKKETNLSDLEVMMGYCIRTRARIPLSPDRPIEQGEYFSSGKQKNGKYCHNCGEEAETSVAQPFCDEHKDRL